MVDCCSIDGFLLLLCERRSSNFSGDCKRSIDTVLRPNDHQVSERLKVEQMENAKQPSIPDFALGVVAGGIGCITEGRRELKSIFCVQELPEDGLDQLVSCWLPFFVFRAVNYPIRCSSSLYRKWNLGLEC